MTLRIQECRLPARIKAFTCKDSDDYYTITINADLARPAKVKALKHELTHIRRDDFYGDDINRIEESICEEDCDCRTDSGA